MSLGPTGHHSDLLSPKPAVVTDPYCLLPLYRRPQPRSPRAGSTNPQLVAKRRLTGGHEGLIRLWSHATGGLASGVVSLALWWGETVLLAWPQVMTPTSTLKEVGFSPGAPRTGPPCWGSAPALYFPGRGLVGLGRPTSPPTLASGPALAIWKSRWATFPGAWGPGQAVLPGCPYIPQLGKPWHH